MLVRPQPLELRSSKVGPWPLNTYAVVCPVTRESILFDPGAEPLKLQALLKDTKPVAILLTHTHLDHIGALTEMRTALNVPVMAHEGPHFDGMALDLDQTLAHGDTVKVGNSWLRVYHTPGHLEDLLCFALEADHRIIVGDTIFEGGPGKTWSAAGFRTTLQTLRKIVLAWPDATLCYPGHGPSFQLGQKRQAIEAFLNRDHGNFFGDATWT